MLSIVLAGLAGILASLSPCVLPILPIVLASAGSEHRLGPLALATGLAVSFATLGVFLGIAGFAVGLDAEVLRTAAAVLMVAAGMALLVSSIATRMLMMAERLLRPLNDFASRLSGKGLAGQFTLGAVLGAAWAPCTGPALGAAVGLAAQSSTAPLAAATMIAFAIGAAVPLLVLGYAARSVVPSLRKRLGAASGVARPLMGGTLTLIGILVLTGLDKVIEAKATAALPETWLNLIVSF